MMLVLTQPLKLSTAGSQIKGTLRLLSCVRARSKKDILSSTQSWFEHIVVGAKLCPFAVPLKVHDTLKIVISPVEKEKQVITEVFKQTKNLIRKTDDSRHTTTLIVFDTPILDDFNQFVHLSWKIQDEVLVQNGFENELQIVLFHPKATHQTYGEGEESAADYTIRSPYPTIHLLREEDVMRAVSGGYPSLEELPSRNKLKFHALGVLECKKRLQECYKRQKE